MLGTATRGLKLRKCPFCKRNLGLRRSKKLKQKGHSVGEE